MLSNTVVNSIMNYVYDQYKQNAEKITMLRARAEELTKELDVVIAEHKNLYKANRYLNELTRLIRDNPGLQENWINFLAIAGIEEPVWKHEYRTDSV